jgi:hypothetical protein
LVFLVGFSLFQNSAGRPRRSLCDTIPRELEKLEWRLGSDFLAVKADRDQFGIDIDKLNTAPR